MKCFWTGFGATIKSTLLIWTLKARYFRQDQGKDRWESHHAPHSQLSRPVEISMWAGQAASTSLSNQGIHCCWGSGYSFTMGPRPALLAVHCCFEQSYFLMPGSLTWISRESFWREMPGEEGRHKKKSLLHNHHLPFQPVGPCTTPS